RLGFTGTSRFAHWSAIALDKAGLIYLVWDPDNRKAGTNGACSGATPAPNSIKMIFTKDLGKTWSKPLSIAAPNTSRVFWPWIAAGDAGKISVVWYQSGPGQLPDNDCQAADVYAYAATVINATTDDRKIYSTRVVKRPIHSGLVCQGG